MKVLVISNYFPPYEVGGYEQLCKDVCERLSDRGHQVKVLTTMRGVSVDENRIETDIHRLLYEEIILSSPVFIQFFKDRSFREKYNRAAFHQLLNDFSPDVIFVWNLENVSGALAAEAENSQFCGTAYWLASRSPAGPNVYWDYWTSPGKSLTAKFLKTLFRPLGLKMLSSQQKHSPLKMAHVGVVSHYWKQKLLDAHFIPTSSQVIHNGVELDLFPFQNRKKGEGEPFHLIQAGRISPDKGIHTTIEAINILVNSLGMADIHLTLAGSGPDFYQKRLNDLVKKYHLEHVVTFTGWLRREEMPNIMAKCDALILGTPENEALARVVLEAMASGLIVISTPTGGMREVVKNDVTGLWFTPGDPESLTKQIMKLIKNPELGHTLTSNARKLIEDKFNLELMVNECEKLLENAFQEKNAFTQ